MTSKKKGEEEREGEEVQQQITERREKMVAISMYRGNMHRVGSDVARRWLMPTPKISTKEFRTLLLRRSKALSLLPSSSSNPNPNPNPSPSPSPNHSDTAVKVQEEEEEDVVVGDVEERENGAVVDNTTIEGDTKLENADDKEKHKREVEEKLKVLTEKKHNLVQALKQILNAEEELKRRSCLQAGRPPLPMQTDASNDSGSMTRLATPRPGSEPNITVDTEGVEGDDPLNQNAQARSLARVNSTSPSAESALRRTPHFQLNMTAHPSRTAGSPSRFAPSGSQGHPSNLLTVSVSATNCIASSPSPAASGGTSGLRDARQPSPWN